MKRSIFLGIVSFLLLACQTAPVSAARAQEGSGPFVPNADEFASAIVMVPGTHQVLYAFKPDQSRVAASLTKLSNALVMVSRKTNWSRIVSIRKADEVGGGRLRVTSAMQMTMLDLLYSSITASANNAATALARLSGLSRPAFIAQMNAQAKKAGATHSHFVDASGMDPGNKTTARDMALIAEKAFKQPLIQRAAGSVHYQFALRPSGTVKLLTNTNALLTNDPDVWVFGGKTGYLEESAYNVAVQMRPMQADGTPEMRKDLLVVVMGAPSKEGSFATAKRLARWAWENHEF